MALAASERSYFAKGLTASLLGHIFLVALFILKLGDTFGAFTQPIVYSITLEGGKSLGALAQVPKKNEKTPPAPPKAVSGAEQQEEEKSKAEEIAKEAAEAKEKAEIAFKEEQVRKEKEAKQKKEQEAKEREKKAREEKARKQKEEEEKKKKAAAAKPKEQSIDDINKQLKKAMQRYVGESSDAGGKGFGAAAVGGSGMGGGVVRPPEFFTYKRLLEDRIKSGWHWIEPQRELLAQVEIEIRGDGEITSVRVVKSSGNPAFDDSVIRAVKKASPVPPPPSTVYEFFKVVRMTFDPRDA